jgi:hypothetical protein
MPTLSETKGFFHFDVVLLISQMNIDFEVISVGIPALRQQGV